MRANRAGAPQEPLRAPFHATDLLGSDVGRMGAEATFRRLFDVDSDLFQLAVEDPHQAAVPANPHGTTEVLGGNRVIRAVNLHVSIAVNRVLTLMKEGESLHRQGQQRRTFTLRKELGHLLLGRAVDPRVSDRGFPMQQEFVLFFQAAKATALEVRFV